MDHSRIEPSIDIAKMQQSTIAIVGVGAGVTLPCNLARCGAVQFKLFDFDTIDPENISRQGHLATHISELKIEAAKKMIHEVNPEAKVECFTVDITKCTDEEIDELFGDVTLIIMATDSFEAQAKGNEIALRLRIPTIWIGLYEGGGGGEVIFWHPGILACHRCLCETRYTAQENAKSLGKSLDPSSVGSTIFDINLIDDIAGQIAIGMITRGSDNRFGRMIPSLGNRNFLMIKNDPDWKINGRDIVREKLSVPVDNKAFFSWNTIALSDSAIMCPCPDCEKYRAHSFLPRSPVEGGPAKYYVRYKPMNYPKKTTDAITTETDSDLENEQDSPTLLVGEE